MGAADEVGEHHDDPDVGVRGLAKKGNKSNRECRAGESCSSFGPLPTSGWLFLLIAGLGLVLKPATMRKLELRAGVFHSIPRVVSMRFVYPGSSGRDGF